jgi:8-amino-7-oxononanoate synthase
LPCCKAKCLYRLGVCLSIAVDKTGDDPSDEAIVEQLDRLERQHLRRRLRPIESACGPIVQMAGRPVILMASNDYLGLAGHPALKKAAIAAIEQFGVGSGAARLVAGTLPPHQALEAALARFKHCEAALVFGSGYLANIGLIPALIKLHDAPRSDRSDRNAVIFADRLCHASVIDGCRLSGADLRVFGHRDTEQLKGLLEQRSARRASLIVTDGVFSMDGDLAPLPELCDLARRYGADLYIDDAHGTGVLGPDGRGTLAHFGLEDHVPFHIGTLGKAFGTSGAYLVGTQPMIDYFINTARSFIYTTAPPPGTCAAAVAALNVLQTEPGRRDRLWRNREYLAAGLKQRGFRLTDSASPILPVLIGDADKTLQMAARLFDLGVYAPAIRPPTVPKGSSRIRLTVTSEHTLEHLDAVLAACQRAAEQLRLLS